MTVGQRPTARKMKGKIVSSTMAGVAASMSAQNWCQQPNPRPISGLRHTHQPLQSSSLIRRASARAGDAEVGEEQAPYLAQNGGASLSKAALRLVFAMYSTASELRTPNRYSQTLCEAERGAVIAGSRRKSGWVIASKQT